MHQRVYLRVTVFLDQGCMKMPGISSCMTCAACSTRLEKVLNRQPGMQANVNLAAERARVRLLAGADESAVVA